MKVLIVGRTGQLATALRVTAPARYQMVALDRTQLDLGEPASVRAAVVRERPDVVINAGAYTNVEQAELEPDVAFRINGAGVGELAGACALAHARLLHVSTDYVFGDDGGAFRAPNAPTMPLNVYGASKLDGEQRMASIRGLDWLVVRSSWVYSTVGRNFMLTMLDLFRSRGAASVVCDQIGTPTDASSLAAALWAAVGRPAASGIVHFANAGVASWYDFAVAIAEEARSLGLLDRPVSVTPLRTSEYTSRAKRPAFSVLDTASTVSAWSLPVVHWRTALRRTLAEVAGARR